jgi:hypothetical protein
MSWLKTKDSLGPVAMTNVVVVHLLKVDRDPTDLVLRPVDPEFGEAVKDTCHDHLDGIQSAANAVPGQPLNIVRGT